MLPPFLPCLQVRLFSVIKYESVIHEFDPYFNYRVTRFLSEKGFYDTWDFFDSFTWYPLGRVVGGTMYPGARRRWWVLVDVRRCALCIKTLPPPPPQQQRTAGRMQNGA